MITEYQRRLRDRLLAAPVTAPPAPWRPVLDNRTPIGGLQGIGFGIHPDNGRDLVMVVSTDGHGLFDAVTGEKIARDRDPDPDTSTPDDSRDLTCPGLGPLAGTPVQIAGLFGGGLHSGSGDGWAVDVVAPEWPREQVILSTDGGLHRGEMGRSWWHVFHSSYSTLRTAGFSPSGRTLAVATSSDLTLWTKPDVSR
ncbi:hypothetical protein [Streptomyces sp. CB03911]|uniref:hypothetical protein n=1 Tax=Streptomyces sp. CB03911 TaxID=1804758 RepID=UPI00093D960C|nr:hypothetical protein [Streptomyces sp. CB03911]OKI11752.1 hypothetical protein A6A07_20670 [Streptomyces sp. CB03911]